VSPVTLSATSARTGASARDPNEVLCNLSLLKMSSGCPRVHGVSMRYGWHSICNRVAGQLILLYYNLDSTLQEFLL
jgi:hypothetical protein